jgi:TRAP-type uncharacterized transport system substrate-binding protein
MRRFELGAIAGGSALIACAFAAFLYLERPCELRVAVPRGNDDDQAILSAAAQKFSESREDIRLKLVLVDNLTQSARSLEEGRADLAVVRTDLAMPLNGQTVLIMRRDAALFMAPQDSGIHGIEELQGHKIGILQSGIASPPDNRLLLDTALAQYDVPLNSVQKIPLRLAELPQALVDKRIDVVLAVGVPGSASLAETVNAVAPVRDKQPVFFPIAEAKAIAQRAPAFEGVEVLRGAFGGAQPKPAADFETLGVSTRLVARSSLTNEAAGELARLMLAVRPSIAAVISAANRIEAPSADKGATFSIHPGVLAFLDDEEKSFFDKYSDMFYIGAMCLSALGTAVAAAMARLKSQKAPDTERILRRLIELIRAARGARHLDILDDCEKEADELLERALALDMIHGLSPNRVGALNLALSQLRHVISERRQNLAAPVRNQFVPRVVNE